jgi:phosphate uptake regulator
MNQVNKLEVELFVDCTLIIAKYHPMHINLSYLLAKKEFIKETLKLEDLTFEERIIYGEELALLRKTERIVMN